MGGKSRKRGGVSRDLIRRLAQSDFAGTQKKPSRKDRPDESAPKGLFDEDVPARDRS